MDLATGTGVGAFAAARAVGAAGSVTGIDVSEKMARCDAGARRMRASRTSPSSGTTWRRPAPPDGAFDAVTCAFGLMFAADRAAALAEIARVTAPGGRVSVCVWGRRAACGFAEVFPIVDAHVAATSARFSSPGGPGALTTAFERAGLTDVVEEGMRVTLSGRPRTRPARRCWRVGRSRSAWNRFSAETRAVVRAEYLASLEPFRHGDRYDVPAEVAFATARKPR